MRRASKTASRSDASDSAAAWGMATFHRAMKAGQPVHQGSRYENISLKYDRQAQYLSSAARPQPKIKLSRFIVTTGDEFLNLEINLNTLKK
ncbi:MAG: hypothetical protein K2Z25_15060 [Beijerinckiaceae bacterium]|nr:hypothetical protein [Beijerinckiaceae bacterium]